MKILISLFLITSLFATYSIGDIIGDSDQQQNYNICAGSESSTLSLSDYIGKVIWINYSASW
tara:strand:+ start:258 stop:443 length:186 start_codon:yes stop_codon:yes gene_type:complete